MALPYPYITSNSNHINTASYFNELESDMFISDYKSDVWYGFSDKDVIEVSAFDLNNEFIGWKTINTEKNYRDVSMTYLNVLDQPTTYVYRELLGDFILYKNEKILVNPIEDASSSFGIITGSYILTYNFVREMAGNSLVPLTIKDISPSRKELKLTPIYGNTPQFESFCKKEFQIKDVLSLLLESTNQCPCDQIYNRVKNKYSGEIAFLKQLLFTDTDSKFVTFLSNLYQDTIVYTSLPNSQLKRTQGIKTYYHNYLLEMCETISNFTRINESYNSFVLFRIEQQFKTYGTQTNKDFIKAKQFLIDFFTIEFYTPITLNIELSFEEKYFGYFKNVVNFGNNKWFVIIDHSYIDERVNPSDPLTLLIKLKEEILSEIQTQTLCWISNISIPPFVINAVFRSPPISVTTKISPPNFSLENQNISRYNVNQSYAAENLRNTVSDQQTVDINKKINELHINYTDFSNFVIFSSAAQRLVNFKKKISTWYGLSSSLVTLESSSSQSILTGTTYPRYSLEKNSIEGQMSDIVTSFDGYESYLFRTGSYTYNATTVAFVSASYVADQDESASLYDRRNRDSLINNTPEHIVLDSENDEYLMFLNMIGHFFDNIYLYITNLPSEKVVENDPTKTFSKKMVDYMLNSFGWKLDSTYEDLSVSQTYTTSATASMSEEDRIKSIRTRILSTLPQIYKTKGTGEAVRLMLSCYGVPSNLLEIREYGNNDYVSSSVVTYTKRERSCLFDFSSSYDSEFSEFSNNVTIKQFFAPRPEIRTVEFKAVLKHPETCNTRSRYSLVGSNNVYNRKWDVNQYYHNNYSSSIPSFVELGYYTSGHEYPAWEIGFIREHGIMGRIYAILPTYTASLYYSESVLQVYTGSEIAYGNPRIYITSSVLPIFDGGIFNIRLRRNTSDPQFEYTVHTNNVPILYDLTVQRNESGRRVFRSYNVKLGAYEDNMVWDGQSTNDVWDTTGSLGTTTTSSVMWGHLSSVSNAASYWELGNAMIWDVPITDEDFEIHCNDFSSFAYSGSNSEKHLITRMDAEEATNLVPSESCYEIIYPSPTASYFHGSAAGYVPNKSEYYSTFYDIFGIPQQTGIVVSGSWIGRKTGNLNWREFFRGYLEGTVTSSAISGSGRGCFVYESKVGGYFSGSMSGSFNGLATGRMEGSFFRYRGFFGYGKWTGSVVATDYITQSYFSGSFYGQTSGTFYGTTTGQMTSSVFGTYNGTRTDVWCGKFTGSASGSIRSPRMTGSFYGHTSASYIYVNTIGAYSGALDRIWQGTLSGSLTGSFTGSTGNVTWTGSTVFIHNNLGYSYGYPYYYDVATFSGSMSGTVSSSITSNASNIYPYASGSFSGSFIQCWTGSPVTLYKKPIIPMYISYGVDSNYYPLNPTTSIEYWYCNNTIVWRFFVSKYPYQFVVKDLEKIYTTPSYGPNRFKNEKVVEQYQYCDVRLDDKERSTYEIEQDNKTDSNLIGLYLDPQDAKNRDIVKFFGNTNIIDLLADPSNVYSSSYSLLRDANLHYNSFGNRKVLYDELIILYKIYFNRSIFDSVTNIVPARSNVRTGIVIEPTVLERPKYQHRQISTELNSGSVFYIETIASHYAKDPITKILRFSGSRSSVDRTNASNVIINNVSDGHLDLVYGEFNINTTYSQSSFKTSSLPSNPLIYLDTSYVNEANFIYPINYNNGIVSDLMDRIQLGNYGSTGDFPGFPGVWGITTQEDLNESFHPSGSCKYFIVKKWDKYTIYTKSGSYSRSSSKFDDKHVTNSVWLYSLVGMTPKMYDSIFYTTSVLVPSGSPWDVTDNFVHTDVYSFYPHYVNTAKQTPNERINTIKAEIVHPNPTVPYQVVTAGSRYDLTKGVRFEVFCGYPRNHYTHKRMQYSPVKFSSLSGKFKKQTSQMYTRGRQTINTTIDNISSLGDGSLPVQTIQISNINLVKSDNVINQ